MPLYRCQKCGWETRAELIICLNCLRTDAAYHEAIAKIVAASRAVTEAARKHCLEFIASVYASTKSPAYDPPPRSLIEKSLIAFEKEAQERMTRRLNLNPA